MPHIILDGGNMNCLIEMINISVNIKFKTDYYNRNRHTHCKDKMDTLEFELGEVIRKYFPDYESEQLSNHEWNEKMNKY